jgi:hypothetical protein
MGQIYVELGNRLAAWCIADTANFFCIRWSLQPSHRSFGLGWWHYGLQHVVNRAIDIKKTVVHLGAVSRMITLWPQRKPNRANATKRIEHWWMEQTPSYSLWSGRMSILWTIHIRNGPIGTHTAGCLQMDYQQQSGCWMRNISKQLKWLATWCLLLNYAFSELGWTLDVWSIKWQNGTFITNQWQNVAFGLHLDRRMPAPFRRNSAAEFFAFYLC